MDAVNKVLSSFLNSDFLNNEAWRAGHCFVSYFDMNEVVSD